MEGKDRRKKGRGNQKKKEKKTALKKFKCVYVKVFVGRN